MKSLMRPLPLILLALAIASARAFGTDDSAQEKRFLSNARQLVFEGKRSGEGYFSPDGKKLIFQSEREPANPFYQQYILDLETGETTRVSPGTGKTTCGFFQAGTNRVLFASTHADPEAPAKQKAELEFRASGKQRRYAWDYDATFDIFSAKQDGTDLVNLTHSPGYDAEGAYSPDGKQIVFCSLRAAFPLEKLSKEQRDRYDKDASWFGDIYIMNAKGTNVRRLTTEPGYDGGPFFSPDGSRIVWRHFDETGMIADVWTMKLDGSDKRRVTDFKSMSWAPFYHPTGDYFIFTSNKLGFENFELFLVDAKGEHEPVRVTFTPGFDGLPVFSPDGKKLCWTSGRTSDGKSQLFLADWNDTAARAALQAAPKQGQSVSVSPSPAAGVTDPGDSAEIRADDLRKEIEWLANEKREGRMTGRPGAQETAKWLADYFQRAGLKSFAEDFALPFQFNAGERVLVEKTRLEISAGDGKAIAKLDADFRPLAFSENGEANSDVVFAGYGLVVPGEGAARYDSYAGLDVKDKIVLIFRYVPEGVDPVRRAQLNRYSGLRYKTMLARERGAKGVLVVTGPNSPNAGQLLSLTNDGTNASSGIVAASINGQTADSLLTPSGKNLKELQTGLDQENPHAEGSFVLPKVKVTLACGIEHLKKSDADIVAYLPPAAGSDEYVLVGAHYDHLGRGGTSSLERAGEENKIHPGADDNASGTGWVMELAASLAKEREEHPEKFRRGVIFACWSGEEIGIIGSAAFCEHPPVPLNKIVAYVNADMVGRLRDNKLTLQGVGSSHAWRKLIEKRNVAAGFSLTLQDDPYLPTDVTSFYPKNVPVLNFFTGAHEDYHRPTDTAEKINYEGLERIAKFSQQIVLDLAESAERPDLAKVERTAQEAGGRETLRAYLGTIPDYTTDVKGVKLSGVRGASPAEKAGLKGGDVIIEFAGQKIANIYDYTYALDAVKIGQPGGDRDRARGKTHHAHGHARSAEVIAIILPAAG
ncbi:MAG: M28 family peptidase [Verrucomicrobiota bacterium]|nr:M28 family peptidase [Verrucomicrobiota bacterium]